MNEETETEAINLYEITKQVSEWIGILIQATLKSVFFPLHENRVD